MTYAQRHSGTEVFLHPPRTKPCLSGCCDSRENTRTSSQMLDSGYNVQVHPGMEKWVAVAACKGQLHRLMVLTRLTPFLNSHRSVFWLVLLVKVEVAIVLLLIRSFGNSGRTSCLLLTPPLGRWWARQSISPMVQVTIVVDRVAADSGSTVTNPLPRGHRCRKPNLVTLIPLSRSGYQSGSSRRRCC